MVQEPTRKGELTVFEDLYEGQPPSRHLDVTWNGATSVTIAPGTNVVTDPWDSQVVYDLYADYDKPKRLGTFPSYVHAQQWADDNGVELYSIYPVTVKP
jgi:hypothetical protein